MKNRPNVDQQPLQHDWENKPVSGPNFVRILEAIKTWNKRRDPGLKKKNTGRHKIA